MDDKEEYYKFVNRCSNEGYFQVIITSSVMLAILQKYFVERKFRIVSIEFMEDDIELIQEVNALLNEVNLDREKVVYLFDKLKFLNEKSSIEIKKVELQCNSNEDRSYVYFQVNGVFGVNQSQYDKEALYIKNIVERYFD